MSLPRSTRKLCQFFEDKEHLRKSIERLHAREILPISEVELLLSLEEKWKAYPTFSRSLHIYLGELKAAMESARVAREKSTETLSQSRSDNVLPLPLAPSLETAAFRAAPGKAMYRFVSLETVPTRLNAERITVHLPTPQLIHDFYESQGIVGEEKNCELLLYGALAKANLGIESLAGSGKSALLYALLQAFPNESYKIIHQATGKSLFNNPERNKVKFWVIPELQKIFTRDIEDLLKNLTEGVSATYTRTNARRDGIDSFEIEKKAVLYSFAITNKHLKERDDEFYRRFIILHTDISRKQNQDVARKFAERGFAERKGQKVGDSLPQRIAVALDFKGEVKNPFLPYIVESLPSEISGQMCFRSSVKYLHSLVAGCTLFYSPHLGAEEKVIFSTFQDNQRVMDLYGEVLVDNLYGLSVVERALLDLSQAEPKPEAELMQEFSDTYSGVQNLYTGGVERLTSLGLLRKDSDYLSRPAFPEIKVDAEKALASADELMKKHYPRQREEWYAQNKILEQNRFTEQNKFREVEQNGV